MTYEDRDFIMRQMKAMAKGLGVLLEISSLKELLKLEFSTDEISDREIESLIYMARIEELLENDIITEETAARALDITPAYLNKLRDEPALIDYDELEKMKKLVEEKQYWMDLNESE